VVLGKPTHRFRYTEECLYAGDPLYVVGWKTMDQLGKSARDAEADASDGLVDDADGDDDAPEADAQEGPPAQLAQEPGLRAHLGEPPPGRGAFIVSTLGRQGTSALHRNGMLGAGLVAVFLFVLLAWMVVARVA
jgi:hypothetical protein